MTLAALALLLLAAALLTAVVHYLYRRESRPAVAARPVRADVPTALYYYRWRGTKARRYVGISDDPPARHRRHLKDPRSQRWLPDTDEVMVVVRWYPNRPAAEAAERAAIRDAYYRGECPANYQHNPGRVRVNR